MAKRYAILGYGAFGTMLDVALMVLGSLLVGLGLAVLLSGLQIVDVVPEELSTGAMLASALVLGVVGLFCFGVASEGPVGRGRRLVGYKLWEVGVGRALAVFVVGLLAIIAHRFLIGLVDGLPSPLLQGVDSLRAVGVAGMRVMPVLGVPLSLLMRRATERWPKMPNLDLPIMYVVWAVTVMVLVV